LFKTIEVEPRMGAPLAEMDHYIIRAPLLLRADMALAEAVPTALTASICLELAE